MKDRQGIIMKRLVFLFCFIIVGFNLYSESVFSLDLKKDIFLSTLSLGVFFGADLLIDEYIMPNNLNRNDVNIFDRGLMFPYNDTLGDIRSIMMLGIQVLPIITPLAGSIRGEFDTWLTYGIMYAHAAILTWGTDKLLNRVVDRYRPGVYFYDTITSPIGTDSFPSGSTAVAFLPATFLSYTFSLEYPDSPWRIPVIVGSYTAATAVGVISLLSGKHFLTDVLAGAVMGTFYGWLIPSLHRRTNNDNNVSFFFTGNGAAVLLRF